MGSGELPSSWWTWGGVGRVALWAGTEAPHPSLMPLPEHIFPLDAHLYLIASFYNQVVKVSKLFPKFCNGSSKSMDPSEDIRGIFWLTAGQLEAQVTTHLSFDIWNGGRAVLCDWALTCGIWCCLQAVSALIVGYPPGVAENCLLGEKSASIWCQKCVYRGSDGKGETQNCFFPTQDD